MCYTFRASPTLQPVAPVGWEQRERGAGSYYYRSVREGNRVKKEYIGCGVLGQIAALLDELQRRQKEEEAAYWNEERERFEEAAAFLEEVGSVADTLVRAHLIAHGFHNRRGQWRRRREQSP